MPQPKENFSADHTFTVMGTVASFTFYSDSRAGITAAIKAAEAEFYSVVRLANLYDRESELSRLNSVAGERPFRCSPEMWMLLMRAQRAYQDSGGNFDVTVKPLMDLWGFYRKRGNSLPSENELKNCLRKVGFDKLRFTPADRSVFFTVPGMKLDLGGIAKGYAVDRAAAAVQKCGVDSGVINLGGNLYLLPRAPKNFYTIAVRDPSGGILEKKLYLPGGRAVATSGDYERFVTINGKCYGHIISPLNGMPAVKDAVTVVAATALDADIFSTTAYLGGRAAAEKLQLRYAGTEFFFVSK